jgi:hypothetical protein
MGDQSDDESPHSKERLVFESDYYIITAPCHEKIATSRMLLRALARLM